jgi:cysteine desulfurase / selenocysteine lyase
MSTPKASDFDVAAVRAQFPIFERQIDGEPLHYLDSAATGQIPRVVVDAVAEHDLHHRANVMRSIHQLAEEATEAFEGARQKVARFVNANNPAEVVFTSGTTGAINLVAYALGSTLEPGDEIVISQVEHHSNIVPWQMVRDRHGVVLKVLPATTEGAIDLSALAQMVTPRTRLISVTHASNVTGSITPIGPVVAAAQSVGAKVLLDGAQRAPHGPLDVQALGVDFYAFSSHKAFGPNGAGVLWGRAAALAGLPPFMGGGEMIRTVTLEETIYADPPHRFEAGTPPIAQVVGMGAALDWLSSQDLAGAAAHERRLTARILDGLDEIDNGRGLIKLIGSRDLDQRLPVVSFAVDGLHPHDICQILDGSGVALRGGHHCAQPLMAFFGLAGTTRASLSLYNDNSDVDAFLNGLDGAIKLLKL